MPRYGELIGANHFSALLTSENSALNRAPRLVRIVIKATAINEDISAYSIAVAPVSSQKNFLIWSNVCTAPGYERALSELLAHQRPVLSRIVVQREGMRRNRWVYLKCAEFVVSLSLTAKAIFSRCEIDFASNLRITAARWCSAVREVISRRAAIALVGKPSRR